MNLPTPNILGQLIQYHRKRSGLSQHALADLAGIGKTAVFDIENGKSTVRVETLLSVLRVLNIQVQLTSPLMEKCSKALGIDDNKSRERKTP